MKKEIAKIIEGRYNVHVDHENGLYSHTPGGIPHIIPDIWIEKAEAISGINIAKITIRFPKPLQNRLNHLKADDKIESIQSLTIKAVSDAVERIENE